MAREPKRVQFAYDKWNQLSAREKEAFYRECDEEIEEIGVVVLANALSPSFCDECIRLIDQEIVTASPIERKVNERRIAFKGYNVYNLQNRHPIFMQHIAYPPVTEYFRRFLGNDMKLYSSEGRVNPPGTGDAHWHYDGYDRIPDYYLSMNSIYYLCDSTKENGSTMYIPGTHKEFISIEEAKKRERQYLNVQKGDVVLFNPYLIHAGSSNQTNSPRPVIINYYVRSYIYQEFDYVRMFDHAAAKKLTREQKVLLGFYNSPARDIEELYKIVKSDANLSDTNPYQY